MEKFGIFFFFTIIGLSISHEPYVFEGEYSADGQKCGLYFIHKGELMTNNSQNGILPMYHKISEDSAFYAIFHYNRNNFAAMVAIKMFKTALKSVEPISSDARVNVSWKSFLQRILMKIDNRLMHADITGDRAESETKVLIAVVVRNKVTVAQIGDMRKVLLVNVCRNGKTELQSMANSTPRLFNVLGGKASKAQNPKIHSVSEVNEFDDFKYLIMGTKSLWRLSDNQIVSCVLENADDLKNAAQKITDSIVLPLDEQDNGAVVIDVNNNNHSKGEKTFFNKVASYLNL